MIDGISITKYLNDEKISHSCLEHISSNLYGNKYKLKTSSHAKYTGNTPVITITNSNKLILKGSLPYLFNDNNLVPFSLLEVKQAFNDLSLRLGVDLSDAIVNNFEFGVAIEVPFPFKEFIHNHISLFNMDSFSYGNKGKYFQDKNTRIKIYDAGRNAKFKLSKPVRHSLSKNGKYNKNSNYVKLEIQYKKPAKSFAKTITVTDLIDEDFLGLCVEDLLHTYRSITKTGFIMPNSAKELTAFKILVIVLKEIEQTSGINVESLVESKIKTLHFFNSNHRYQRRKTIKQAFKDIHVSASNPYDITNLLKQAAKKFLQSVAH